MKIRPVGVELFHAVGRDEANCRFSQFCERAENVANPYSSGNIKTFES